MSSKAAQRRPITTIMIVFAAVFVAGGAAFAASSSQEGFVVSADEYSLWDGSRLFVAEGNVSVRWKDALITSDVLQYDADAGFAVFLGNVFYADGEQELAGNSLHYDLNEGVAVFDEMEAVLYSDGVKGPMFVTGDRVRAAEGEVRMDRATFTTCECEGDTPAYRFVAKELEIYPNDRIIARGVVFYDHKVPLLYIPYLTLSLEERTSRFDMPQIGYSERTGWYVKLTYNYVLKSGLYGALLFDYFQLLGPGGGVRHTYVDDETGTGTLYAYGVGDGAGGVEASFAWNRHWTGPPWDVRAHYAYDLAGGPHGLDREELRAGLQVERRTADGELRADGEYRLRNRATWAEPQTRLSANGSLRQRLGDEWELRLQGETFDETRGQRTDRWIGYAGELRRTAPNYTLITRVEQQVNPDLKDEEFQGQPSWLHVSRLPEVQLQLRRMNGWDVGLGAVRLQEEPSKVSAWRGEAQLGLATRTWRLSPAVSFNVSGSARGRAYTTGDQQLTVQSRAGLNVRLGAPLSATLQYNYREMWGETPFRFDRVTPAETFSPRLNWRSGPLTASLNTTYNFRTERWSRLSANATWRPTTALVLRASGTFDVYNRTWERVIGTVDWRAGEDTRVRLGARYNVPRSEWERMDADIRLAVGGGWEAGVTAIYDFTRESFSRNHMYISHNACGCREIRLRYDQLQGEVWVEYHITAFPSSRVALGAGDDKLMFESDALSDFLND